MSQTTQQPGAQASGHGPTVATMGFGVVVFLATLAAWLYGEQQGVNTAMLWTLSVPLVLALFLGQGINEAAGAAKQAAAQTNGVLDARIRSAVQGVVSDALPALVKSATSAALADRDAARTRQARGDIGQDVPPARAFPIVTAPLPGGL